ncbi:hypothetical protein C8R44DRAFT_765346 [Mycena epipterygia]|nr:hypothetical protein C8R44DRAFT_765346 [Mycena epipterygia]
MFIVQYWAFLCYSGSYPMWVYLVAATFFFSGAIWVYLEATIFFVFFLGTELQYLTVTALVNTFSALVRYLLVCA